MSSHGADESLETSESEEELFDEFEPPPHENKNNVNSRQAKLNLRFFISKWFGGF